MTTRLSDAELDALVMAWKLKADAEARMGSDRHTPRMTHAAVLEARELRLERGAVFLLIDLTHNSMKAWWWVFMVTGGLWIIKAIVDVMVFNMPWVAAVSVLIAAGHFVAAVLTTRSRMIASRIIHNA